jgi:pimeloyl-ACP methyl ester carboxylesterase
MAQQLPAIDRVMFVLLHGACHGAWCWDRVRPLLEQAGRDVVTPTLTGLGEREDELSPDVGLSTHVDDVVRVLEQEDLTDVVLVGHSYAGMILPPVAVRAADRLARLVFLDAFVPKDGDRCFDLMPAESAEWLRQQAQAEGGGWRFPAFPLEMLGIVADEDVRWVGPRLTAQPLKTYEEAVRLPSRGWDRLPRTYVFCNERSFGGLFEPFAEAASADPAWNRVNIAAAHEPFITAPEALSRTLLQLG